MNDITVKAVATGRMAYQVVPDPDDPVILQIDSKLSRVLDISATGFSMPGGIVASGRRYPYTLDLPTAKSPVGGYVDALPGKSGESVHCVFVNLSADEADAIHRYVLIRQKEAIRSIRTEGSSSSGF